MPIKSIKVSNVMAFQRQWRKNNGDPKEGELKSGDRIHDAFTLEFSDGINVMIGENGTGKTTLLKMIYAATQWSNEKADAGKTDRFYKFFSNNLSDSDLLKNEDHKEGFCYFEVSDGEHSFQYSLSHKAMRSMEALLFRWKSCSRITLCRRMKNCWIWFMKIWWGENDTGLSGRKWILPV